MILNERDELKKKLDDILDRDKTGLITYDALLALEAQIMARYDPLLNKNVPVYTLLDIDYFKQFNTNLGYEGADEMLRKSQPAT